LADFEDYFSNGFIKAETVSFEQAKQFLKNLFKLFFKAIRLKLKAIQFKIVDPK